MTQYPDWFVLSQYEYYRDNLRNGHRRDWNIIQGLYELYKAGALRRGLIL